MDLERASVGRGVSSVDIGRASKDIGRASVGGGRVSADIGRSSKDTGNHPWTQNIYEQGESTFDHRGSILVRRRSSIDTGRTSVDREQYLWV